MNLTLGFIIQNNQVLLGWKKRGFGMNQWAGFGGKIQDQETLEECMIREFGEESGLEITEFVKLGVVEFEFEGKTDNLFVHIYKIINYIGQIIETDEMKPAWFDLSSIPFNQMWPDNEKWWPYLIKELPFTAKFIYNKDNKIVEYNIKEVK